MALDTPASTPTNDTISADADDAAVQRALAVIRAHGSRGTGWDSTNKTVEFICSCGERGSGDFQTHLAKALVEAGAGIS